MIVDTRLDEMELAAMEFHKKYPQVWNLFVKFAKDRISRGFTNYSADAVMHRVRWETAAGQSGQYPNSNDGKFKINDHHVAFYGRWFMRNFPEPEGFFRVRDQTSRSRTPYGRSPNDPRDA